MWSARVLPADTAPYQDPTVPIEQRITDLMDRLTPEEKANLCYGSFVSGGISRLNIPALNMLDGRQGVRPTGDMESTRTTLMPCALALSCTWNDRSAEEFGQVLAEEMLALKQNVLLAPMLNLVRSPLGGRNFENFGEDPYLVGQIGSAYIQGVQQQKVGACSCLLVANDCEHRRHFTSSNMDERTLRELHLLGYEMSVRNGGVWSMMSGNNLLNGVYCAQNRHLVQELMKDEIGFDGVMITDWRAAYDTVPAAIAGTDMTTGLCSYVFGDGHLLAAVKDGQVSQELLDDKVRRVLRLYIRTGVLDPASRRKGGVNTQAHQQAARRIGAEGMVLLKNQDKILPLDPSKVHRILITGPAADKVIQGGGSGSVPAAVEVTPLQGLKAALKDKVEITWLPCEVDLSPAKAPGAADKKTSPTSAPETDAALKLPQAAKDADIVLFVAAGTSASEGRDLLDMELPGNQAKIIAAIADANPRVVVALVNNGAIAMDKWQDKVSGILAIHYAGQATGDALADVIIGKVNPSGKLSYTWARRLQDYPCHTLNEWPAKLILAKDPVNPGRNAKERKANHAFDTDYKEGVFAGYRWFDDKDIEPIYPFGFGLSYTTFDMSNLKITRGAKSTYTVSCTVRNSGDRAGAEIVQIYVKPAKASVPRPPRELKGYSKVMLKPGESQTVQIKLPPSALAYYDVNSKKWKAEAGDYEIQVGNSSRDDRLHSKITLPADESFDHL
jgi:beta-glucosidase